jgi:hypothetical protein
MTTTCSPIKTAARWVGCGIALASVTALLSLVFNFLGTILCASLTGMMLGAMRRSRWPSLPLSFIFPAVILVLFRLTRTEMPDSQVRIVSLLCFGAFWLLYGATALVVAYERAQKAPAISPQGQPPETGLQIGPVGSAETLHLATKESQPHALEGLCLGLLQGKWSCIANGHPEAEKQKVMLIEQDHLALSFDDPQGHGRLLLRGAVRVENIANTPGRIFAVNPLELTADTLVSI